jgi:hypothetical protein
MQTSNIRGLHYDLSSNDYHNEKGSFSSSQLKDLIEDPEYFYRKHIKKEIEREQIPAFDIGTYFHTALLEPEKLTLECAVFEGVRRGKDWDKFKEDNAGKAIITKTEFDQAQGLINAVKNSPIASGRLGRGRPEVSCFVELLICGSSIYSTELGAELTLSGWQKAKVPKKGISIVVKVRADLLGDDFILDLKSTTGNTKSAFQMRQKISSYQYDLSAALYIDMFNVYVEKTISDFIWVFSSKDYFNSKSYVGSGTMIQIGRAKYMKALLSLAEGIETDWQFEDSLGILEPQPYELEWIKPKDGDLL